MAIITISAVTKEIDALARRLVNKSSDNSKTMGAIAGVMLDAVEENFEKEGRPDPWEPLAASTVKQRERKGFGETSPILQREGILAAANQPNSGKDFAEVTNATVYGPIQHFGGKAGRGKKVEIPERPFMFLTDEDVEEIEDIFQSDLDRL